MTPTSRPRHMIGTERNDSNWSSGRSLKNLNRGSFMAFSGTATGSRCSATQPVMPSPIFSLSRSMISGCGFFEARSTSSSFSST